VEHIVEASQSDWFADRIARRAQHDRLALHRDHLGRGRHPGEKPGELNGIGLVVEQGDQRVSHAQ